ncbi:DUF3096 domain-containing protein [Metallibacterium sp.]
MNLHLSIDPLVSLIAGILVLILIVIGLTGLLGTGATHLSP